MPKAIVTRYKGPTDTKGSRIIADDGDGNRVTISYPHDLSGEDVHRKAAVALCVKMGWPHADLIGGYLKNGMTFVTPSMIPSAMTPERRQNIAALVATVTSDSKFYDECCRAASADDCMQAMKFSIIARTAARQQMQQHNDSYSTFEVLHAAADLCEYYTNHVKEMTS